MNRKTHPPKTTPVPADAFVPGECLAGRDANVIHWRGQTCSVYRVPIKDLPEHRARYGIRPVPDHPLQATMERSTRWWPVVIYAPIEPNTQEENPS